ncbi:Kcnh2 [Symbiodinium sp. CCMP2456]|nr:Kcnh2 [Symbiodinium sp. CCMP2456]
MVDTSNVSKAHEELAEVHEVAKSLKCMTSVLDKQLGRLEAKCAQSLKGIIEDINRCLQRLEEEVKQAISDRDPRSPPDPKGEQIVGYQAPISLPIRHRGADADEEHRRSFDDSVQKERSLEDEQVMLSEGDTPSPKADDAGALAPFKTPREVCLVDPSWTSKLVWDIYVMLVVLMDAMVLPFQLSFKNSYDPDGFDDFWFWLTTMTFSADIIASFNTAIPRGDDVDVDDAKETLIVERRVIAVTYLRGWFVLDFISTVPWSRIVDTMVGPGGGPMVTVAKLAKVLKFIRIIRLMKMLRAKKLKDIWEQVEKRIGSVAIVQGMMLIRVLLVVVGICHWNACLFWIVGARESIVTDFMPTTLKDQFDRMPHWTTISRSDAPDLDPWTYERKPMFEQYIFCFYWTLGVMRTMPAEVTPVNAVERVFVLCFMFFALSAFAVSVASLTQAYFKISERGRSFNDEMFAIRMHLHKLRMEETSQRKIKEYLHHKFTRRRIMAKEANLLKELPIALKEEVENAKVLQQVHHLPCMQGLSKEALKQVCKSAEFLDILPGEHLVCAGDVTHCAWVVCSGTIKVEDVMGQKCVVDGDPPVINAECLQQQEPFRSPTTVTTTSTCELYKLEKTKFFEIAAHHLTKQPKMKRQQSGPTALVVEEATDRVTTPHASAGAAAAISAG